jgi:hypothetical protein
MLLPALCVRCDLGVSNLLRSHHELPPIGVVNLTPAFGFNDQPHASLTFRVCDIIAGTIRCESSLRFEGHLAMLKNEDATPSGCELAHQFPSPPWGEGLAMSFGTPRAVLCLASEWGSFELGVLLNFAGWHPSRNFGGDSAIDGGELGAYLR